MIKSTGPSIIICTRLGTMGFAGYVSGSGSRSRFRYEIGGFWTQSTNYGSLIRYLKLYTPKLELYKNKKQTKMKGEIQSVYKYNCFTLKIKKIHVLVNLLGTQ